jgi:hypothetical protein
VASLTAKGLDPLGMPMLAISDEGVDMSIGDPVVGALLVGTGKALGIHLGDPRRLFTSGQGRTGAGASPTADEGVEARRQAGQSYGQRGLSRRWNLVRILVAALDGAGP